MIYSFATLRMTVLTLADLRRWRDRTYRRTPEHRATTLDEAVAFVNAVGFCFFWPIGGVELPSLWAAVAGDRPVPSEHDDPGHITWDWKDSLLGQRRWFYAKLLRRRATLVSLDTLPYFYALSENFGDPPYPPPGGGGGGGGGGHAQRRGQGDL